MARLATHSPGVLLESARGGSRAALAQLISNIEQHNVSFRETVALAYATPTPYVLGITGAPGAGKSTLTNQLVGALLRRGHLGDQGAARVGVLCIDPTSPLSGGALLGDRIRLHEHAHDDRVYVRSLATRGAYGGLARCVPDAVRLLGAAGFPIVIIETVGVGQVEVDIASASDCTVVVLTPGWGDDVQTAKAGLLEVADAFVINKADHGDVAATERHLASMLSRSTGPVTPIVATAALSGAGIDELCEALDQVERASAATRSKRRRRRLDHDVWAVYVAGRRHDIEHLASDRWAEILDDVENGSDPYRAVEELR